MISTALKRQISKAKHYYLTVVFSLALTLAMVFSVFSIVDSVYLQPLPYDEADGIYQVEGMINYQGKEQVGSNPPALFHVKKNSTLLEQMAIYMTFGEEKIYSFADRPDVPVYYASPDFFTLLKVKPVLGRFFNEQEATGNKQPSAVLSYQAWQTFYDGSEQIIGQKIQLEQKSYTIVGIAPDNWVLPNKTTVAEGIWLPQDIDAERFTGFTDSFGSLVRFKPGVTVEEVEQEISPIYYQGAELAMPQYTKILSPYPRIKRLTDAIRGDSGAIIYMLVAGVFLLMFIALVNLGNLQMARAAGRVQPLAISYAFGATRKQIFKELLSHNLILSCVASILGLALTSFSLVAVKNLGSEVLPRMDAVGISIYMLVFATLVALALALIFSWIEMQAADESNLKSSLQSSGKGVGKQMKKGVSHLLIGLQLLFSVLTLVSTSQVLSITLTEALRPTKISTDDLWSAQIGYSGIESREERKAVNTAIVEMLKSKASVTDVSESSEMRVDGINRNFVYNENNEQIASVRRVIIDDKQLELFNIQVKGRNFEKDDFDLEFYPVIINERLASHFPDNPIGQKIILDDKKAHEIIGIASNTDYPGASYREDGEVYLPSLYEGGRVSVLLIKTLNSFEGFNHAEFLAEILSIDPRLDLSLLQPVTEQFSELSKNHRFAAYLAGAISLISLVMVVAGILGMVSYMVNIRRYDLGVKMAMGANNKSLLKGQLGELTLPIVSAMLFAFSLVIFVLGYSRTIPEWVFDIQWGVVGYSMLLLVIVAVIACFIPIMQVLRTDPIKALRNE